MPDESQQSPQSLWEEVKPAVRSEMDALVTDTLKEVLRLVDQWGAEMAMVLLRAHVEERTADA